MSTTPQQQQQQQPPSPPPPWPDKPIIRIVEGYDAIAGRPIRDTLAVASSWPESLSSSPSRGTCLYTRLDGGIMCRGAGDLIESWEEVTAVPVSLLLELGEAFEGLDEHSPDRPEEGLSGPQIAALRGVLACLPES